MPTLRMSPETWSWLPLPGSIPISRSKTPSISLIGWLPNGPTNLKRDPAAVKKEIEQILQGNSSAPWYGLAGEKFINVLEVNLELRKRYGAPQG